MSKYKNHKITFQGEKFDSKLELDRWLYLKALEQQGQIFNLRRQVKYILVPSQRDSETRKVIEREITYIADFVYEKHSFDELEMTVEDVKGVKTRDYIIKRKLMLYFYGVRIREVTKKPQTWR